MTHSLRHFSLPTVCRSDSQQKDQKSIEDILFQIFQDHGTNLISVNKFLNALAVTGIRASDPRLKETIDKLRRIARDKRIVGSIESMNLDLETFKSVVRDNILLISRALRQQFAIPDFAGFTKHIDDFYWACKTTTGGKVADYIPQLSKVDPDLWGVSLCTVDGQRHSIGDTEIPFTIQSSGKPINYGIALNCLGTDAVHSFVGQEPSGRMFNELILDHNRRPHNPMVNAGAIVVCSLILYMVEVSLITFSRRACTNTIHADDFTVIRQGCSCQRNSIGSVSDTKPWPAGSTWDSVMRLSSPNERLLTGTMRSPTS
jgi:glutaminase